MGVVKSDAWKPSVTLRDVLTAIWALLADPQPEDALEAAIAEEYRDNRPAWEEKVRESVRQYASGDPVFN